MQMLRAVSLLSERLCFNFIQFCASKHSKRGVYFLPFQKLHGAINAQFLSSL